MNLEYTLGGFLCVCVWIATEIGVELWPHLVTLRGLAAVMGTSVTATEGYFGPIRLSEQRSHGHYHLSSNLVNHIPMAITVFFAVLVLKAWVAGGALNTNIMLRICTPWMHPLTSRTLVCTGDVRGRWIPWYMKSWMHVFSITCSNKSV